VLRLADVSKHYGWGRWILHNVDLEVPAGQIVAINGANGFGSRRYWLRHSCWPSTNHGRDWT
jgi:ABC-type branched-subunit amino acid transport system ATPase component